LGLFVMSYLGIAISLWPMIVPRHFTLEQAAASQSTQAFLFDRHVGAAAGDFALYGLVVLGLSRQGAVRHWISLRMALCRRRLNFYVVLRKLIPKLQAFPESIQETSMV
jgi:hypothetical protein